MTLCLHPKLMEHFKTLTGLIIETLTSYFGYNSMNGSDILSFH